MKKATSPGPTARTTFGAVVTTPDHRAVTIAMPAPMSTVLGISQSASAAKTLTSRCGGIKSRGYVIAVKRRSTSLLARTRIASMHGNRRSAGLGENRVKARRIGGIRRIENDPPPTRLGPRARRRLRNRKGA